MHSAVAKVIFLPLPIPLVNIVDLRSCLYRCDSLPRLLPIDRQQCIEPKSLPDFQFSLLSSTRPNFGWLLATLQLCPVFFLSYFACSLEESQLLLRRSKPLLYQIQRGSSSGEKKKGARMLTLTLPQTAFCANWETEWLFPCWPYTMQTMFVAWHQPWIIYLWQLTTSGCYGSKHFHN